MRLFGFTFDVSPRNELCIRCEAWLKSGGFHRIATVNPEFMVRAWNDFCFASNLRAADLRVVDGIGIVIAGLLKGKRVRRFPGADLMESLLGIAEKRGYAVACVVRRGGLSSYETIKQALLKKYPVLKVTGIEMHATFWSDGTQKIPHHIWTQIQQSTIVFCNFGAPEQEYFTESLRVKPGSIRLAMGVGGSFDYLTSKLHRAPRCMRHIGLEWLWRLVQQPQRLKRIWRATVVFPYKSILNK